MKIKLTRAQWKKLHPVVAAGAKLERKLGLPIELDNGDQHIEIQADEVKIVLED